MLGWDRALEIGVVYNVLGSHARVEKFIFTLCSAKNNPEIYGDFLHSIANFLNKNGYLTRKQIVAALIHIERKGFK